MSPPKRRMKNRTETLRFRFVRFVPRDNPGRNDPPTVGPSARYLPTVCACTLVCATLCKGQMYAQACACIPLDAVCAYTRLYVRTHFVVVVKTVATQTTRRRSLPAAPFEDRLQSDHTREILRAGPRPTQPCTCVKRETTGVEPWAREIGLTAQNARLRHQAGAWHPV